MRAIGYREPGDIRRDDALTDSELPTPEPASRDILVQVRAVSVNPVDTKMRKSSKPEPGERKVLGWDPVGVVSAVGSDATLSWPGNEVFYAGAIGQPGTNSEYHLVDERIVGAKPWALDWGAAAALPLTAIIAWEALFDRLDVHRSVPGAAQVILTVGGAGGVGSIALQIARALTNLTVVATASRPETVAWVKEMGAHHVVNHAKPLAAQVAALDVGAPAFVFSTTQTIRHLDEIAELIAPQGRFALINDPATLNVNVFKRKSVSIHLELMCTRSIYGTPDIGEQGQMLNEVSRHVDAGTLRTAMTERVSGINVANLRRVHAQVESGTTRGKIVLEGFGAAA